LITFFPHPRLVLKKADDDFRLLNTKEEKAGLLEKFGIDHFVILPFTPQFAQMSPDDYVRKIYIDLLHTHTLVIGYDHRFGKDRVGGIEFLHAKAFRYGFAVEEIPRQDIEAVGISSTRIRQALTEGNVALANQYSGHNYSLVGIVQTGDKIGRTLGFPTANLQLAEDYKLIPADGIYAVSVHLKAGIFGGMLYIGHRPTLQGDSTLRIEVNIFDFDQDIYGQMMKIELIAHIRGDMKFDSLESLQKQMHQDRIEAQKALARIEK
jgi:riboflavin kinase/FMN adenylyltransferase